MEKEEIRTLIKERLLDLEDTFDNNQMYRLRFNKFEENSFTIKVSLFYLTIEQVNILLDSMRFAGDYFDFSVKVHFFERGGMIFKYVKNDEE